MLQIVCIKAGSKFGPDYVNILFDMVRRNLAEGYPGTFTCFTDNPEGLNSGITVRPLPVLLQGWWSKLALFKRDLFSVGDRVLFLDLDTLITGRIDALCDYAGPFAILRDAFRFAGLQSSVMAWQAGECSEIWESYEAAGCPQDDPKGDQAWIEKTQLRKAVRFQNIFPNLFVSYKKLRGIPIKESVVFFHGEPRPHQVKTGWVPMVWKIGGISRAEIKSICNTQEEKRVENVKLSCKRDIPWVDLTPEHDGHAVIVGGGPSLSNTIFEIIWRKSQGQKIWAMNGSAAYLRSQGIIPDFHVFVDARPENVAFTQGADNNTVHLVASQVDPCIFDALNGKQVFLWHVNSPGMNELMQEITSKPLELVGGGSTVGLNAMVLAHVLGYRKIHLHGFDSSYVEDKGHAYSQPSNASDAVVDAVFMDKKFKATPWMVQQAEEFVGTATELADMGSLITVHGTGLLPSIAFDMSMNQITTPAEIRAHEILKRLNGIVNPVGAEIGVFAGDMSKNLLLRKDLTLYMVDSWRVGSYKDVPGEKDFHCNFTQNEQDAYFDKSKAATNFANGRAKIIRKMSVTAANYVFDSYLDFAFIDADHSYEGCASDIAAWLRKVKPGGWLCGHDYENYNYPNFGVTKAVNEISDALKLPISIGENFTWFIQIPKQKAA